MAEVGSQLAFTSARLGTTSDELQKFHFAGEHVGLGAEQVHTAIGFFNKSLGKAEEGSKAVSKAFARLGVVTKDASGQARPLDAILGDVADGFAKMTDRGAKTATATELFGRARARLLPLLEKGRDGVGELTKEFEALGAGYSRDFIAKPVEANRQIVRNRLALSGLKSAIGSEVLPIF